MNISRKLSAPEGASLAGYSWLIDQFRLDVPIPAALVAICGRHRPASRGSWTAFPVQYQPTDDVAGHITFALKREGVDLAVLHALFTSLGPAALADVVRTAPTGAYLRRAWFLYEWITGDRLPLPDLGKVRAVDAIDPDLQVALPAGPISARHKVRDNLPGTPAFCPLVRRTPAIVRWQAMGLPARARAVIGRTHPDVLSRAAAFLLLSDSRASYRIEGEQPSQERAMRWGQAIARAGSVALSVRELEALQRTVIGDDRFVQLGLRVDGGFVGEHDRETSTPLPQHISARPEDLRSLVEGLVAYDERVGRGAIDPVVAAACEAFGFVYIHPFEDGNGRIHRWLIHHVLTAAGFAPPGLSFPVSAVILRVIDRYRRVLESYSRLLLEHIRWRPTANGNVEVLNETAPWYRYFDATVHAEFLYECVASTITDDLPREIEFLEAYDRFTAAASAVVDMPSRTVNLLERFLRQDAGHLSHRARTREFAALTDDEVTRIELLHAECFVNVPADDDTPPPVASQVERG